MTIDSPRIATLEAENARLRACVAVMEKALSFYADKSHYVNRPIDVQRELNGGKDPTVARSDVGEAPPGCALSDIQMDGRGDRARAALTPTKENDHAE